MLAQFKKLSICNYAKRLNLEYLFKEINLDDPILKYLDAESRFMLSTVNKAIFEIVRNYNNRHHDIRQYLRPFVNDIDTFLSMIKYNDIYISGSTVIQTILGYSFNANTDLDIYFTIRNNPKYSTKTIKDDDVLFRVIKHLIEKENYKSETTQFTGVCSLNTYFKLVKDNGRKIDIIIEADDIKEVVKRFYATHTMNYYDPDTDKILSLRPYALQNHISYLSDWFLGKYFMRRENFGKMNSLTVNSYAERAKDLLEKKNQNVISAAINNIHVEGEVLSVADEFDKYSIYFKFKKIEALMKYNKRGFEFNFVNKINNALIKNERHIQNHNRLAYPTGTCFIEFKP